jgi:hypothetical protein
LDKPESLKIIIGGEEVEYIRKDSILQSIIEDSGDMAPFSVGRAYFIRTVTHHLVGMLAHVGDKELVLTQCSWIADDGRFSTAMKTGQLSEIEPFPDTPVIVGRAAIIDAHEWKHKLPQDIK